MQVDIAPELEELIRLQVTSGRYRIAAKVVEDASRRMADEETVDRLRGELAKGREEVDRGEGNVYRPGSMER